MDAERHTNNAPCPKCQAGMIFVIAIPHRGMHRTTFVCHSCNQTKSYMLSPSAAAIYSSAAPPLEA
jgi:transposase-like protein